MTGPLPRLAARMLSRVARPCVAENVMGDLEERWRDSPTRAVGWWRVWTLVFAVGWHTLRETRRDRVSPPTLAACRDDVRAAIRSLVRRPRLSLAATLTLAIGLASSTAMLAAARTVLRPALPFPDAGRLVHLWAAWPGGFGNLSYPDFEAIRASATALDDVAAYESWGTVSLGDGGRPISLTPTFVSDRYLPMLGATATLGRLLQSRDQIPGAPGVVVLSEGFWTRQFAADPRVIGRTTTLNGLPYQIVGVVRAPFPSLGQVEEAPTDVWLPTVAAERLLGQAPLTEVVRIFWAVGHLAPDGTTDQLQQQLNAVAARMAEARPTTHRGYELKTKLLTAYLHGAVTTPAMLLVAGALLMLVVGCANVANLLLASAAARRGELALCEALGASRARLLRQALVESALLAGGAATLGLLVALVANRALATFVAVRVSPFVSLEGTLATFGIAGLLALVTTVVVSVPRVLLASRIGLAERAALTGRGGAGRTPHRLRMGLVVTEVALTTVLLAGVGLLGRSLARLTTSGIGFSTSHLLTFRLDLSGDRYATDASRVHFADAFVDRVQAAPDVESATVWGPSILGRSTWVTSVLPDDRAADRPEDFVQGSFHLTSVDGLRHLGIPIVAGREFTTADRSTSAPVIVISEGLARELWPRDPVTAAVGTRLRRTNPGLPLLTVVGVARDAKHRTRYSLAGIAEGLSPLGLMAQCDIYFPYAQRPMRSMTAAVRVRTDAQAIDSVRSAIASLDAELALDDVQMLDARLAGQNSGLEAMTIVMTVYAVMAAFLAAVGLYAALANLVYERQREIGIRMALGARQTSVRALILRAGALVVCPGLAVGLVLAALMARAFQSILYGVAPVDPASFGGAATLVAAMCLGALRAPVMRATRISPTVALRQP